jgi:hypothetical protein
MRQRLRRRIVGDMTLHEHLEENSFAYCDELPPDVAEGLPLTAARKPCDQPRLLRILAVGKRVVSRKA